MSRLARGLLLMALVMLVGASVWQSISLLSGTGQALAPVTGQYYVGASWMAPTTATPTPVAAAINPIVAVIPPSLAQPTPTALATATPPTESPGAMQAQPSPLVPLQPTPDPFLVDVAQVHGIDPAGTYVIVNQNAQRMTIVEQGRVLRTMPISTGDPDRGWFTPGWSGRIGEYWGTFTANGVSADNAWYLFQAGGSILIHSSPYTLAPDGSRIYQGLDELGVFPASRGCIRIAPEDAVWFSDWGPYNTPIVVLPWDGGTGREG
jgi:lipoprotein-anchoring transpeptidase ErfK/SrfK